MAHARWQAGSRPELVLLGPRVSAGRGDRDLIGNQLVSSEPVFPQREGPASLCTKSIEFRVLGLPAQQLTAHELMLHGSDETGPWVRQA